MSNLESMSRKIQAMQTKLEPAPTLPTIRCVWGDEETTTQPGQKVIKTVWGAGALDEEATTSTSLPLT